MRKFITWMLLAGLVIGLTATTVKVSSLEQATTVADADITLLIQSGTTRKATACSLKAYVWTGVTSSVAELNVLDGVPAGLSAAELGILDGVTATAVEINKLHGVVSGVSAAEISYVNGVTSNIQTQLDAKQAYSLYTPMLYTRQWTETGTSETILANTILAGCGVDTLSYVIKPGVIAQSYYIDGTKHITNGDISYQIDVSQGQNYLEHVKIDEMSALPYSISILFRVEVKTVGGQ